MDEKIIEKMARAVYHNVSCRLTPDECRTLMGDISLLESQVRLYRGTTRRKFTCPRCGAWVEAEVDAQGRTTCPACENDVRVA